MKYKEIIYKRETLGVAEERENYYPRNSENFKNSEKIKNLITPINNEHDKIFRKILDNKQEAANFINKTLKLKKPIKPEQLEKYNSSFITEKLQNRESDVVYKIKDKKLFILIEHQTKIDYKMPYRILEYEYELIRSENDYKALGTKEYKIPAVISIVLYTGKQKWNVKKYIEEVQEKLEGYEEIKLAKYDVVDVNDFSKEELIKEKSFLSKAMLIEKAKNNEEVIRYLEEITTEINENEEIYTEEIKQLFTVMINQILKIKIGEEKAEKIMQDIRKGKGGKNKVMTVFETIEEDNKLIFSNGMKAGIKTGIKTGINKRNLEIIKNMLKENLPIDLISKITGISQKEINKMK